MKKVLWVLAVVGLSALSVLAERREEFSVNELSVDHVISVTPGIAGAKFLAAPKDSFSFMDDFFLIKYGTNYPGPLASWMFTGDTAESAALIVANETGGILKLLTGSTSNNETYVQYGPVGGEAMFNVTSNGGKKVTFEVRVAGPIPGANCSTFVGLSSAGSSAANFIVDTTGVMADKDFIGFQCNKNNGNASWDFVTRANGGAITTNSAFAPNSGNGTYVRLGFQFDGINKLRYYYNGSCSNTPMTVTAVNCPNAVKLSPIIACKTLVGTYTPTNKIDYIYVQQDR
jgi:hypothetical protein